MHLKGDCAGILWGRGRMGRGQSLLEVPRVLEEINLRVRAA